MAATSVEAARAAAERGDTEEAALCWLCAIADLLGWVAGEDEGSLEPALEASLVLMKGRHQ